MKSPVRPELNQRDIRSFVIRGGRITEAQQKAFDLYWPQYGLSLQNGIVNSQKLFGNNNALVVEIGYGMGDSLLAMAEREPDKNFIGIEVHLPGVGRLVNEAGKRQLANLKTYCADAVDVLTQCIPENSVSRLQLFFPDPWHKKRHHKRRIVQADFVKQISGRLCVGGIFHMATDWQNYAEAMLSVVNEEKTLSNLSPTGDYCVRPDYRPVTKFERRGERLGHGVWDILVTRGINPGIT
jgi:tRNA (guanine-N7-)-methyltransferase